MQTLIDIEDALIDLFESKSITAKTFYEQLIPVIYDYLVEDEVEMGIIVLQQIDAFFLQSLSKYAQHQGEWESKAFYIYNTLGLAYCMPKVTGDRN